MPDIKVRHSGFPLAGGILAIISACICAFVGIISLARFASYFYFHYWLFFVGMFALVGFIFGLTGGILALRRRYFEIAIFGVSLIMLSGFVNIVVLRVAPRGVFLVALLGIPILILSIMSLIFIVISQAEFM